MKLGVIAVAVSALFLSASPAFCDQIPNTRHAPLVVVSLNGSASSLSATEALMEGTLENNTYLRNGAADATTDPVAINSNGSLDRDRLVLLPTSDADAAPSPSVVAATPEPGSLALFGIGAMLAAAVLRRRLRDEDAEE